MDSSNPSSKSMAKKEASMRSRFKKRRETLLQKTYEVSTLCDVDCCIIVGSPFDNNPLTWPPEREQMEKVIGRCQQVPEVDRNRRMMTPEKFYGEKMMKLQEKIQRVQRDNRRKEVAGYVSRWLAGQKDQGLNMADLHEMDCFMTTKLSILSRRIEEL